MEKKRGGEEQYLPFCVIADYANVDEAAQIELFGTEVRHCRAGKSVEVAFTILDPFCYGYLFCNLLVCKVTR